MNGDKKGFTLIELLVSITVFAVLISAMMGILISGIQAQRRSLAQQDALNQLSFAIEYMSRALRMAKKENGDGCLDAGDGYNYENPGGDISEIRFINHLQADACQRFYEQDKSIRYEDGSGSWFILTKNIIIEELRFELSGENETDNFQPRVTIFIQAISEGLAPINLQTTISQRNPDVP
ncbi:MAG: type II secretion system protein [Candidatus Pacebacteria bacterium]|nr:type II secretion system protein [Candidatus Paceibacterota bacterium]